MVSWKNGSIEKKKAFVNRGKLACKTEKIVLQLLSIIYIFRT